MVRKILYAHLFVLLLFVVNILIAAFTGYNLNSYILLAICTGYYLTLLSGFLYVRTIDRTLKEKLGYGINYVLSLAGIFLTELLIICITALYIFIVLLFKINAPVKATGQGYEIRSEPSLEWPPRYVLYQGNFMAEKSIGDIRANEEDFEITGNISSVNIKADAVYVSISGKGKDTVLSFGRY